MESGTSSSRDSSRSGDAVSRTDGSDRAHAPTTSATDSGRRGGMSVGRGGGRGNEQREHDGAWVERGESDSSTSPSREDDDDDRDDRRGDDEGEEQEDRPEDDEERDGDYSVDVSVESSDSSDEDSPASPHPPHLALHPSRSSNSAISRRLSTTTMLSPQRHLAATPVHSPEEELANGSDQQLSPKPPRSKEHIDPRTLPAVGTPGEPAYLLDTTLLWAPPATRRSGRDHVPALPSSADVGRFLARMACGHVLDERALSTLVDTEYDTPTCFVLQELCLIMARARAWGVWGVCVCVCGCGCGGSE